MLFSLSSIWWVQRLYESRYGRLTALLHRSLAAPLPDIVQASIQVEGVETFTNTTQATDGALNLNLIQGDVL